MRLLQYLQEARRNPEMNQKIDIIQALEPYKDKKGYFIHFTDIPKLGMNPKTPHETPMGIYAYPLREMWKNLVNDTIPYAGDAKYVFLFKFTGKYLDAEKYTESMYELDKVRLFKIFKEQYKGDPRTDDAEDTFEDIVLDAEDLAYKREPISELFNVTRNLAKKIAFMNSRNSKRYGTTTNITKWTKLLQELGYDAVIDWKGRGIIHQNEPTQAVFFNINKIQVVDMLLNKRFSKSVKIISEIKKFEELVSSEKIDSFNVRALLNGENVTSATDGYVEFKLNVKLLKNMDDLIIVLIRSKQIPLPTIATILSSSNILNKISDEGFEKILKALLVNRSKDSRLVAFRTLLKNNVTDKGKMAIIDKLFNI